MQINLNLSSLKGNFSTLSFLLLFPGYFLYHFAIGKGYLQPLLGGYFGIITISLIFPLLLISYKTILKNFDLTVFIFFLIMLLTLCVAFIQNSLEKPLNYHEELFEWTISGLVFNLVCFFCAVGMKIDRTAHYAYWSIILMCMIVVTNIGNFGIFSVQSQSNEINELITGYQGFARSIIATLLVCSAYFFNNGMKFYFIAMIGIIALFFNGARTEFALFPIVLVFVYLWYSIRSVKVLISLFFSLCIFMILVINVFDFLPESRMMRLIDFSMGSSGEIRVNQITFAIQQISENPLLGNYGAYAENGGAGAYPHNILSAWMNLSLVGFLLYIILFICLWAAAIKGFLIKKSNRHFNLYLFFLIFSTVAILAFKNHSYMFVGLTVGFYIQYCNNEKNYHKKFSKNF